MDRSGRFNFWRVLVLTRAITPPRVVPGLWLQTTRWSWLAGFALACSSVAASAQARLASGCIPRGKIGRLWGAHCAGQDSRSVDAGLVVGAIGMWIRQRLWRSNRLRLPSQMSIGGPGTAHRKRDSECNLLRRSSERSCRSGAVTPPTLPILYSW